MEFGKYIMKFMKNTEKYQTHLSFTKGKYNVPDDKLEEFYTKYYETVLKGDSVYLIEKIYNCNFNLFFDLDTKTTSDSDILCIVESISEIIKETFKVKENENCNLTEVIVSKRESRYHLNYPNLVVNSKIANSIVKVLNSKECNVEIDTSVYRTGLRMLGSKKNPKEKVGYQLYNLEKGKYMKLNTLSYELFKKTIIRTSGDVCELKDTDEKSEEGIVVKNDRKEEIIIKGITNDATVIEIKSLLEELKVINRDISEFDFKIDRIYAKQNKLGLYCYYISIFQKWCPFQKRPHKRESNPIYIEMIPIDSGLDWRVYIKCYNSECLRKRFPEEGLKLPENWTDKYKELYLSMSSKYWDSEVTINNEIRKSLEDSLDCSHYQISKAAFMIYKDRFRVDDIKNATWYEFDGFRWKKSHLMNILISEELPKYYNGIKTINQNTQDDLQEFLQKKETLRNGTIDGIVSKLQNVNFKNKIMEQMAYLFKTYDPLFYEKLDNNPDLLGFKNGVYDFSNNEFRNVTPEDYLTYSTGYDFIEYDDTDSNVIEIYEFLQKIIPDKTVLDYLLKVLGRSLIGRPDEKFYIWSGLSGANGKSTLVNFLEQTLGDYTTSIDVSLITNKRAGSGNASPDVVRLRGKRLFTLQEPESDDKLRTGILKQYTGGDTIIARELFKAPITFKLQGTMVMCCNDLPVITSNDGGTFRRISVMEFKSRFCDNPVKKNEFKIDLSLKTKLNEWKPYFMSILIYWYNKSLYEGIEEPDEVKRATTKYKGDNDKFTEFFESIVQESNEDESFESIKNIYNIFIGWWNNNYPATKLPDIREFKRSIKMKFGEELLKNGQYGYLVNIKKTENDTYYDSD